MAFIKNVKWTPKTIAVVAGATTIVIGLVVFFKVGLPAIMGRSGNKEVHLDMYAELDCTDAAADALSDAMGSKVRCTGEVIATFNLKMDNGEFTMELDRKALDADLEDFVVENSDSILKAQLAAAGQATDTASLDAYAVSIGYANWNAAVNATANSLMSGSFERATEGDIVYEGTYTIAAGKKDNILIATYSDGKNELFSAEYDTGTKGVIYMEYSFDRQAPEFMYDYFNRGVELEFVKGSGRSGKGAGSGRGSNDALSVNFILDTVPTTTTTTEETTTETTPPPTTEATAIVTNPDGTPQTNADGTPVTEKVTPGTPVNPTETIEVTEG